MKLKGIGASSGIAIGQVKLLKKQDFVIVEKADDLKEAHEQLAKAFTDVKNETNQLKEKAIQAVGQEEAAIFDAHLMLLDDPSLVDEMKALVDSGKSAGFAVESICDMTVQMFESLDDEYMRERASDIRDIKKRLLESIFNIKSSTSMDRASIIVAHDLTPSETVLLDPNFVKGFITEIGGATSHSAIIARNLGIPCVLGVENYDDIVDEMMVIMDGDKGHVILSPSEEMVNNALEEIEKQKNEKLALEAFRHQPTKTKDGDLKELFCNIGNPSDAELVNQNDGEGVGLFRSEFLYMDRQALPSEEVQFNAYKEVLESVKGSVIIRTLDIGGDKEVEYLNLPKELNPFLGYRAIRICLEDKALFQTQLRALYRASHYGKLKIMIPMISSMEELLAAKEEIEECKRQLDGEDIPYGHVEIGMMVEVPSVAIMADEFAKHVDFFSIGTNDLTQYTTATDRINPKVAKLYSTYNPAVLHLIKNVCQAGNAQGIDVGMCGEAASDPKLLGYLLGVGLKEFSVSPSKVLKTRSLLSKYDRNKCNEIVENVSRLSTAKEVSEYLEKVSQEV